MALLKLKYFYLTCVTCVILALSPLISAKTEWIDPHSMEEDPRIQCNCPSTSVAASGPGPQSTSVITSYYTRTINLILSSLRYDNDVHSGQFDIELVKEDYEFMNDFLKSLKTSLHMSNNQKEQDWDRMDRLLTKMFANKENTYLWQMMTWKDYLYTRAMTREFAVALGCVFLLWFIYKLKHTKFHLMSMVKYFMFILYVIDYAYTWIYMLKEKELEQLLKMAYTVPPECNVKNMGYFEYFQYLGQTFRGEDKCAEYHKIKDIDIFWSVSPSQVIGAQMGNMVLAPAEKIGNAFSKLLGGVLKNASWYTMLPTVVLLPVLLFGLILGGCVLLSFVTGRGFSFNLMHLFAFSFGGRGDAGRDGDRSSQPTINVTLPQIQVGVGERKRLKGEKKKSIAEMVEGPKMAAAAVECKQGKRQVEVEDVTEAESNEGNEPVLADAEKCDVEDDYEVIS